MKTYKVVLKDCTWHIYTVQADNEDEAEINAITTFSTGDNGKEESELTVDEIIEIKSQNYSNKQTYYGK